MHGGKLPLAGGGGRGDSLATRHLDDEEGGAVDGGTGARGVRAGAGEMKYLGRERLGRSPLLDSQLVDMGVWERGLFLSL
ncbi:MAG: hypothetical protein ACK56I_25660, partial [bacterium]